MAKYTGKAGSMTWNSSTLTITKVGHKIAKSMADSTDSSNFVSGNNQLFKSQLPGDNQLTLSIEGYFDSSQTPTNIYAAMLSDAQVAIVTNITAAIQVAAGNFDISDWESDVTVPGGVMVDFKCTAMSNGAFTLGA
jgi:hypothetical protein